ncbi:MAG TPA: potassium transporter TrkG [Acidimicrobiales bacterium]
MFPALTVRTIGLTMVIASAGLVVAAVVDAATTGDSVLVLVLLAAGLGAAGYVAVTRVALPERAPLSSVFGAASAALVALVAVSALPYLLTGELGVADALFEGVAGATTTAATVIGRPEDVDRGLLMWRATTQWYGGLLAVVLALSVLPFLGTGEGWLGQAPPSTRTTERFVRRVWSQVRPVVGYYLGFTVLVAAAYQLSGMGAFDAATHALTTVSTGGFSTRTGSMTDFGAASQWVATVAMFIAGGNVALYIRAVRTRLADRTLRRSVEARLYLSLVIVVGWLVGVSIDGSFADRARIGLADATSLITTTGFVFGRLPGGSAETMLLIVMGIGAMSGSPSGGFRLVRVVALFAYLRREVSRQLHDRAVKVVRVGRDVVDETLLSRMIGFQAVFSITAFIGATLIAIESVSVIEALSASVSAIATVGPVFDGVDQLGELPAMSRAVAAGLMLLGRLEVYPIAIALSAGVDRIDPVRQLRVAERRIRVRLNR